MESNKSGVFCHRRRARHARAALEGRQPLPGACERCGVDESEVGVTHAFSAAVMEILTPVVGLQRI